MSELDRRIDALAELFSQRGSRDYLGEPVTVADHMLQCAALAETEGAPDALIAAALLHDIGHLSGPAGAYTLQDTEDRRHEEAGAHSLKGFPQVVVESVRLHVAAKRYLCATDPAYQAVLSTASRHSLELQGGPMGREERRAFETSPFHREAIKVRCWDDAGKRAGLKPPPFDHYRPLLRRVLDP